MLLQKTHKKWRRQNLNKKSDRPSTSNKTQSPPISKNEQTVMARDELMAFTAVVRFGSQQLQNKRQRRRLML